MLGFGMLVKRYNRLAYLKQHAIFLKEINENEVLKLKNKLSSFPTGEEFTSRDHPFVSDLDVFGSHSLFQLLNRTTTGSGMELLANWLSAPAPKEVINERQQAIKELSSKIDWRQDFQAAGMHFESPKSDFKKLLSWIDQREQLLPRKSKYLIVCSLLTVLSILALGYYLMHLLSPDWLAKLIPLIIISIVNYLILKRVSPIAEEIIENTHHNIKILGGYQALIIKIESVKFNSEILHLLQKKLIHNTYSAAREIDKLKKILAVFQLRGIKGEFSSFFYSIFNILWLLDVYWIILTEKWKYKNKSYLKSWVLAVSEFEVLNSLAGFSYSNPSFAFPEITDEPYNIHFETLGHPLIISERRVCNNFNLNGCGAIAMITGSNMAGKSTFLRTVGVNLVLGLMGAPCGAKSGKISNMRIFTSMRTQDNLEEGISSFYAELRRTEQLLKIIKSGQPLFFLLDEMFKGTNSEDRHKGGFSLIKQLGELNAFGIIATHDLDLAKLVENHKIAANYSFNSLMKDGEMIFNYELTSGICKDFNASELMKRSG